MSDGRIGQGGQICRDRKEWGIEGRSVQLAVEVGGRGSKPDVNTSRLPLTMGGSGETFLAFLPPSQQFGRIGRARTVGVMGPVIGIGGRKDEWIGRWTSCHDDRIASECVLADEVSLCLLVQSDG